MNERIRELLDQAHADLFITNEKLVSTTEIIDRFATLLVQDVLYDMGWQRPRNGVNSPENLQTRKLMNHIKLRYDVDFPAHRQDFPTCFEKPRAPLPDISGNEREFLEQIERKTRTFNKDKLFSEAKDNVNDDND